MLGVIYGCEVSGERINYTLFNTTFNPADQFINGGHFGLEGGVVTSTVCVMIILLLILIIRKEQADE